MSPRRITFSIAVIVLLSAVPVVGDETSEPAKIDQFMRLARSEEGDEEKDLGEGGAGTFSASVPS